MYSSTAFDMPSACDGSTATDKRREKRRHVGDRAVQRHAVGQTQLGDQPFQFGPLFALAGDVEGGRRKLGCQCAAARMNTSTPLTGRRLATTPTRGMRPIVADGSAANRSRSTPFSSTTTFRVRPAFRGQQRLPGRLAVGQRHVGEPADDAAEPAVRRRQPVAEVVADPDHPPHAGQPGQRHAEIRRVEEVRLNDVDPVLAPEAGRASRRPRASAGLCSDVRPSRSTGQSVGFERAALGVGAVEQDEGRVDAAAVEGTDQGEHLRLGPAAGEAVDQEADADRRVSPDPSGARGRNAPLAPLGRGDTVPRCDPTSVTAHNLQRTSFSNSSHTAAPGRRT